MAPLMHPGPLWDHFLSHPANFLPLPYAVAQLPAPQPPLSDLKLKLLHHTHRLLQDLAHLLKVTPLVQAAARLSSSIQALPEDAAHQPLVQHLTYLVQSAADALQVPRLPTYLDDLIDVYCEAEHTFTATIPRSE